MLAAFGVHHDGRQGRWGTKHLRQKHALPGESKLLDWEWPNGEPVP